MIEPILDNLLLEPITETKSEAGIFRPEGAKEKPEIGKILATGPKCETIYFVSKKDPTPWKAVYKKWMGTEIKHEGKTYVLVAEKDVLGVIK